MNIDNPTMRLTRFVILSAWLVSPIAAADTFTVDVWADNWFQFSVDGVTVARDSVAITTERSFNAEQFSFESDRPFTIGLTLMDFKENDTGLEYIGTHRQQMGDGGVIAQITDSVGTVVAVTSSAWRCLVVHEAPLDKRCETEVEPVAGEGTCKFTRTDHPIDWNMPQFDDSGWQQAHVYSPDDVRPKGGYDRIKWDNDAELIWGPDLETNNTVLCRLTVD